MVLSIPLFLSIVSEGKYIVSRSAQVFHFVVGLFLIVCRRYQLGPFLVPGAFSSWKGVCLGPAYVEVSLVPGIFV